MYMAVRGHVTLTYVCTGVGKGPQRQPWPPVDQKVQNGGGGGDDELLYPPPPLEILATPLYLYNVFKNFQGNAFKFYLTGKQTTPGNIIFSKSANFRAVSKEEETEYEEEGAGEGGEKKRKK